MSLQIFGVAYPKVRAALLTSLQASALSALRRRHPPDWPDPLGAGCRSQRFGRIPDARYTHVLVASSRFDLLRYIMADLAVCPVEERPRLIVVAADPSTHLEYTLRAQDWFRIFAVAFELWLPDVPPSREVILGFAEHHRGNGVVLLTPCEAFLGAPGREARLVQAAQSTPAGVALGHPGAPWLVQSERIPVLAWARDLRSPWPRADGVDVRWAPASAQALPPLVGTPVTRRAQVWLYRRKDPIFAIAGKLAALAGRPREGFLGVVEHCFLIPGLGYFVSGWLTDPLRRIKSVTLAQPDMGWTYELSDSWIRVPRPDIDRLYRQFSLPEPPRGFVAFVREERITAGSTADRIEVLFRHKRGVRKVSAGAVRLEEGPEAVRELLSALPAHIPQIRQMMRDHVNPAVEVLYRHGEPAPALTRGFGPQPPKPEVSVVVPLYGRWDFMRYQLAAFCQDPGLRSAEWLYVIDDPRLVSKVLEAADALYLLFGLPFRVLYCGRNLGFSGACNLGAREARSELLLLLNSDVFPIAEGWLGQMRSALTPEVGAVGARLLYEDGSVQHAGMRNEPYHAWDGLDISTHPGKGFPEALLPELDADWPAATAACLLMRRAEYLAHGGLSQAFVTGDFEDGDLCRRLREAGRRIRIAQNARLYHLERQSISGLGDESWRQWLTLYNCWLFNERAHALRAEQRTDQAESILPASVSGLHKHNRAPH